MDVEVEYVIKLYLGRELSIVEVYEDYFLLWSDKLRSMFIKRLSDIMESEMKNGTRWKEFTYDRCRHCIDYLKKKFNI